MENTEIWKTIPKYRDYELSNFGKVKSYKNNKITLRKITRDFYGHPQITLSKKGKQTTFKIYDLLQKIYDHKTVIEYFKNL